MRRCLLLLLVACSGGKPAEDVATVPAWRQPGDVIDSILPMAEYERRFRSDLTEVTALSGGAASIDALTRTVLSAVAARDTAALAALAITRAEFAWLVFPDHLYRSAPYELDPALFWSQIQQGSSKGARQLLEHYGGRNLALQGVACSRDTLQVSGAALRIWSGCQVDYRVDDDKVRGRIFGSIVEQGGSFKLLSYSNDF